MTGFPPQAVSKDKAYRGEIRRPDGIYATPRRFSIKTIMAATLALAALLGVLARLGTAPEALAAIVGYISVIAVAQAMLYRGRKPRLSSVLAGGMIWLIIALIDTWNAALPRPFQAGLWLSASIFGLLSGYVVGLLVAGVFMFLTMLDKRFTRDSLSAQGDHDHTRHER